MANGIPRRRSIFSGLVLILIGTLFLLHNQYGGFGIGELFRRWWPLLLILWGLAKLYDRMAAHRSGEAAPRTVTGGEVMLIVIVLSLAGLVGLKEWADRHGERNLVVFGPWEGNRYTFDEDVAPKDVAANSRITVQTARGDVVVRTGDAPQIRVAAKKYARGWGEREAQRICDRVSVKITQTADGYEVRPEGLENAPGGAGVDLEVTVPGDARVTIRNDRGGVQAVGAGGDLSIDAQSGDVEVRGARADVSVEMRRGDVRVSDAKGNVKLAGRGGEIEVRNVAGSLAVDGEFFGPIRAEKVAKGVRFVSQRTNMTLTQLSGRFETGSGNLEITDSTGNLTLKTRAYDISLENVSGRIQVQNRDAKVELRFSQPPIEDVEVINESAGISLTLPSRSSFEIHADSRSGEIDSEFSESTLKKTTDDQGNSKLDGRIGGRGPQIRLKTSYGSIEVHKLS